GIDQLLLAHAGASLDIPRAGFGHQLVLGLILQRSGARAGLAGSRGLFGRIAAVSGFAAGGLLLAGAARTIAATGLLVDGSPGTRLGFLIRDALAFVTLFYVFSLALLLVGVFVFIALWHDDSPLWMKIRDAGWPCGIPAPCGRTSGSPRQPAPG